MIPVHMHNMVLSEKSVTIAETNWLEANKYQIWKNAPKWENSVNIELFSISIR